MKGKLAAWFPVDNLGAILVLLEFLRGGLKSLAVTAALLAVSLTIASTASAAQSAVTQWNSVALREAHSAKLGSPIAARALAIVHTCIYDSWAAYDEHAMGTQLRGALRRPIGERTEGNKQRAISYAAFRALSDLFPANIESTYKPTLRQLGYDPNDRSTDIETPAGIGNVACGAVLEYRHHDHSNQLGDLAQGPFNDWTHYAPVNQPSALPIHFPFVKPLNSDHWQPLTYTGPSGSLILQMFSAAHWGQVTPFALSKGDELRDGLAPPPARYGSPEYEAQARELIDLSANLTDRQKMIAEFWTLGSGDAASDAVVEHWLRFAELISVRDHHSLDEDVKMYFALSNAMFDASIAAYDAKRALDSVRPITTIAFLFRGKKIRAWGGPGKGPIEMDGSDWLPYQPATSPTPPSPEYVSATSAESAAAAEILRLWTGSEQFEYSITLPKGSSKIEPDKTPAQPVTLHWHTFSEAADEAGMAGRYAGIHFAAGDLAGRALGRAAADSAWAKTKSYISGVPSH